MPDSAEKSAAKDKASGENDRPNTEPGSSTPLKRGIRWRLSFADRSVEEEFLRKYRDDAVQIMRWGVAVALFAMLIFVAEDKEISPLGYRATNIRIYLAAPLCLLTWYVLGITDVRRYIEPITSFFLLSYSCLVAAIYLIFEPGFYGLSGSVASGNFLMIMMATFTLSYLRFVWALFVGIGILSIYWISAYFWVDWKVANHYQFVSGNFGNVVLAFIIGAVTSGMFEVLRRRQFKITWQLVREKERYKELLYAYLPSKIASRIEGGEFPIADSQAEVAIVFSDLVGFTALTQTVAPRTLVELLNELFIAFDQAAERHGVEKIKTIGDGYMAACGLPMVDGQRTLAAAHLAGEMISIAKRIAEKYDLPISVRVGIHTGSLIAGVIGKSRYMYDMWGESVNMASRMESSGIPNRVHISQAAYKRLKDHFPCEPRGEIEVKGIGPVKTYLLGESMLASKPLRVEALPDSVESATIIKLSGVSRH